MDIDRYVERAGRLDLTGIDFDAFRRTPLDPDVLRCLRYMHDVEHHTVCYLRDLLVTPAHRDPRVTTFLTVWNYEEMWHGDALGRVLAAHGEEAGPARIDRMRRGLVAIALEPFLTGSGRHAALEPVPRAGLLQDGAGGLACCSTWKTLSARGPGSAAGCTPRR